MIYLFPPYIILTGFICAEYGLVLIWVRLVCLGMTIKWIEVLNTLFAMILNQEHFLKWIWDIHMLPYVAEFQPIIQLHQELEHSVQVDILKKVCLPSVVHS